MFRILPLSLPFRVLLLQLHLLQTHLWFSAFSRPCAAKSLRFDMKAARSARAKRAAEISVGSGFA